MSKPAGEKASGYEPRSDDFTEYHLTELRIAQDSSAPGHLLPPIPFGCKVILDIGCGAGQTAIAIRAPDDILVCGVDPDISALLLGASLTSQVHLSAGRGEELPFADRSFDLVYSRVALPYMHFGKALAEIARVLRSGGTLWLSLHPTRFALDRFCRAIRERSVRGALFAIYTFANSVLLLATNRQLRWPFGFRRYESVQTRRGMLRALRRNGFVSASIRHDRFFVVTARLPEAPAIVDAD